MRGGTVLVIVGMPVAIGLTANCLMYTKGAKEARFALWRTMHTVEMAPAEYQEKERQMRALQDYLEKPAFIRSVTLPPIPYPDPPESQREH